MKQIFLAIAFAVLLCGSTAYAQSNSEIIDEIHAQLDELNTLIVAIEKGTITIFPGNEVTIPAALINTMKSRCGVLRTSLRGLFLSLSLEE